jgi:glycosyltransferase 2 family protein
MMAPLPRTSLAMSPRLRSLLLQLAFLAIGLLFLHLALREVAFDELGATLAGANYWYLVPLAVVALFSHLLRAWRWLLLLEALPEENETAGSGNLKLAFYSVMIGYMVNFGVPRLGEVARAGNFAAQTRHSFPAVFGTVASDRVLDVIVLALGILLAVAVATQHMADLSDIFGRPLGMDLALAAIVVLIAGLVLGGGALLWFVRHTRRAAARPEQRGRVAEAVHGFLEGLASLMKAPRRLLIAVITVAIWLCYLTLAYLPLPLLGITGLGVGDVWLLMIAGSLAMLVPAPAGVGPFHYVTIMTMTRIFGISPAAATAYAVITHGGQLVLYVVTGFICLLLQGRGLALKAQLAAARRSS